MRSTQVFFQSHSNVGKKDLELNISPLEKGYKTLTKETALETPHYCSLVLEFPDGCLTYYPPLPRACLNTVWLAAGCTSIGFGYPGDLNASEFAERWMDKNLRLMGYKFVLNVFIRNGNS